MVKMRRDTAHMIQFGFEQSGNIGLLTFDGALTKQRSGEMKTALMRALHRVDHLVFNLEKVTALDIACFRLICMAHRISRNLGKRLTVTGFRQKSFTRLFEDNRFKQKECFFDCLKVVCRWKHPDRSSPHEEEPAESAAALPEGAGLPHRGPAPGQRYETTVKRGNEAVYER